MRNKLWMRSSIRRSSPTPSMVVIDQPKTPTTTLQCRNFPRPKAQFIETKYLIPPKSKELEPLHPYEDNDDDEWFDDVDKEDEEDGKYHMQATKRSKVNRRALMEWVQFCAIMTSLICSLTLKFVKNEVKWVEDMKMVPHGNGAFLHPPRLRLGGGIPSLHHWTQLHASRKGSIFCVWPLEELLGFVLLTWMIMFPNVHKHNKVLKE